MKYEFVISAIDMKEMRVPIRIVRLDRKWLCIVESNGGVKPKILC